jgi:hypothetical protein
MRLLIAAENGIVEAVATHISRIEQELLCNNEGAVAKEARTLLCRNIENALACSEVMWHSGTAVQRTWISSANGMF